MMEGSGMMKYTLMRYIHLLFCILMLASGQCQPLEQRTDPAWHILGVWRQPQGLPQNSVLAIVQTSDGYIWAGTRGGLARFDGMHFTTFDTSQKGQLKENEIWALVEGNDSSLWIGTYGGGLTRLKDGKFTTYTTENGL